MGGKATTGTNPRTRNDDTFPARVTKRSPELPALTNMHVAFSLQ